MRTLFIAILLFSVLSGRAQTHVDTALYAILPYDEHAQMAMNWQFPNAQPDRISKEQVDSIESLIDSVYSAYLRDAEKTIHLLQPLSAYRRQYVAFIDENGDRQIWNYFFCSSFGNDWRQHVMIVDDGGGCFFEIQLNRSKKKIGELQPNGVALYNSPGGFIGIVAGPNHLPALSFESPENFLYRASNCQFMRTLTSTI